MPMQLIDGKKLADGVRNDIQRDIHRLGITPGLAVVLVGNDPASHLYVTLKEKAAKEVGIYFEKYLFFATTPEADIGQKIIELNRRTDIHGIIVQLPLPAPLSDDRVIAALDPKKDVDGFCPKNIEALLKSSPLTPLGNNTIIIPSVGRAILALIDATGTSLEKKNVVVLANSDIFSRPLRKLLYDRGGTVTTTHPDAADALQKTVRADVIITAIGRPHYLTAQMAQKGVIIIDVGTSTLDGKIVGDAHPNVSEKASWLTPVPGGVGPMTVAYLLKNVVDASIVSQSKS